MTLLQPDYVPWSQLRTVIFDIDGTLYAQWPLRWRMAWQLLISTAGRRRIGKLYLFRKLRHRHRGEAVPALATAEYGWCADALGCKRETLQAELHPWLHQYPLSYIKKSMFAPVPECFGLLRKKGLKIGVFSDYPAEEKLQALGLRADAVLHAAHPQVEALKPHPRGLTKLLTMLGVSAAEALYIGNSMHQDRPCAEAAGMPFLHVWPWQGTAFYHALIGSLHRYSPH